MIKNILIPERLGNYYIFQKRIVGFDIDKTHVTATQVHLKGKTVIIERCLDEILDTGNELTYEEKVTKAIKNIVSSIGKFDEVYTSISSLNVIFKSLRLPFVKYEKIKSIINYEVEPLLPFSASQALIDFIITKEIPDENSSEVMVAAVQANAVEEHVKLFTDAGISPTKVVVDLFALYSFYKNIPEYENTQASVVLIDVGFNLTRLSFINNGQLIFVRTFPKGIFSQAKDLAKIYSIPQNEAAEMIMRYGYQEQEDDPKYKEAIDKVAASFWSDIKFTIGSFVSKLQDNLEISKVLILGQGAKIVGITEFVGNFLSVNCQLFKTSSLTNNPNILIKNSLTIPSSNIISLATVFPSDIMDKFNLYKFSQESANEKLIIKQFIVAVSFIVIIISILFVNSYIKVGKLRTEIESSEQEVVDALKKKFKLSETENSMGDVISAAETKVAAAEKQFSSFGKSRFSFLKYLLDLTEVIDKERTGIKISSLVISQPENTIILSAEVRDYDAIAKLTKDIRAKKDSFGFVQTPQEKNFVMKIDLTKKI